MNELMKKYTAFRLSLYFRFSPFPSFLLTQGLSLQAAELPRDIKEQEQPTACGGAKTQRGALVFRRIYIRTGGRFQDRASGHSFVAGAANLVMRAVGQRVGGISDFSELILPPDG